MTASVSKRVKGLGLFLLERVRLAYVRCIVAPTLRRIGPGFTTRLARRLAGRLFELNPAARARGLNRLHSAIEGGVLRMDRRGADVCLRTSHGHLGRFWGEAHFLRSRLSAKGWRRHVRVENEESIRSLADSPRGCIVAVGYHGNIAAAARALGHLFGSIHVVVDRLDSPQLRLFQTEIARCDGIELIERPQAATRAPEILERGGAVMIVAEHESTGRRGVPVEFLGRRFRAVRTIGLLSRWYDAPVAVVTCPRGDGGLQFDMRLHAVIEPRELNDDADEIVRRTMSALERGIAESPEQYFWSVPTVETLGAAHVSPRGGVVAQARAPLITRMSHRPVAGPIQTVDTPPY